MASLTGEEALTLQDDLSGVAPRTRTPLFGRQAERATGLAVLAEGAQGRGHTLTLEGEAGIGKTFLMDEIRAQAVSLGFRCLSGAAEELERHRPFGAIAQVLGIGRRARGRLEQDTRDTRPASEAARASEIALLLVGGGTVGSGAMTPGAPEAQFRIVDALVDYVEHLAAGGPLLLTVEDLQWADPSSLRALDRLASEIERVPLIIAATLRPVPRSHELQLFLDSIEATGGTRIILGRLDDEAVAALVEALVGARPGEQLLAQMRRAGGNPLFATELVAALQQEGAIRLEGDVADTSGGSPLPASLSSALLHRVSFLSPQALETLQVASVLGSTFTVGDLAAVMDQPPAGLLADLRVAVQAGILNGDTRLLTFRHDLIREALYYEMPAAVRHALHLSAANALLEVGLPPEEVAEHVLRSAVPGDVHTVEWLSALARRAGLRSPAIAIELLSRALELVTEPGPLLDATLADLAVYLVSSGNMGRAEAICRGTLDRPHDVAVDGSLRLCLVQACVGQGRIDEALAEIDRAEDCPTLRDKDRGRLWAWAATCRVILWDLDGAWDSSTLATAASRRAGDDVGVVVALAAQAAVQSLRGEFAEGLALLDGALTEARRSRSPEARRIQMTLMHALTLIDMDRFEDAQHALRRGRFARERRGARWNLPSYHFVSAIGCFATGEWDEAIAQYDSGFDFTEEVVLFQGTLVARSMRSLIALHRGDLPRARREMEAAEAESAAVGPQWRPDWLLWSNALLLEAEGRRGEALRTLAKAWQLCEDSGVVAEYPLLGPDLVRLARSCGEPLLADHVASEVEALAARSGVASIRGAALRCRGMLTGQPELFLRAVEAYRASGRIRETALTCEDAACVLAAITRQVEARPLAEEALARYQGLGARRDAGRARERFKVAGIKGLVRGERPAPKGGWEGLTRAETEVSLLVAEGLTNPEIARRLFISPRTVQSHVSHALDKLKLGSRVELAVVGALWQGR